MLPNPPPIPISISPQHQESQYYYFPSGRNKMKFKFERDDMLTTWVANCQSSSHPNYAKKNIMSNFHKIPKDLLENIRVDWFLIDDMDGSTANHALLWAQTRKDWPLERYGKFLSTQAEFSEGVRYTNIIYVRIIPAPLYNYHYRQTIFTSQILDLIPVVLAKQKTTIKKDEARLASYREKWGIVSDIHKTIDFKKFERILRKFDVNFNLLAIIEDPLYELSRRQMRQYGLPCQTVSPNGNTVMETSQAIQVLFQDLVVGVNWKKDSCEKHTDCQWNLKKRIRELMTVIWDLKEATFINTDTVTQMVENSKLACQHSTSQIPFFSHLPANSQMEIKIYHGVAERFDLPKFQNFIPKLVSPGESEAIPIWMHRLFLNVGWLTQFLSEDSKFEATFVHNMCHMVPDTYVEETKRFVIGAIHERNPGVLPGAGMKT